MQIARQIPKLTQSLTVESAAKGRVPVSSAYLISASLSSCAEFRALNSKDRNLDTFCDFVFLCPSSFIVLARLFNVVLIVPLALSGITLCVIRCTDDHAAAHILNKFPAMRRFLFASKKGNRPFRVIKDKWIGHCRQASRQGGHA